MSLEKVKNNIILFEIYFKLKFMKGKTNYSFESIIGLDIGFLCFSFVEKIIGLLK